MIWVSKQFADYSALRALDIKYFSTMVSPPGKTPVYISEGKNNGREKNTFLPHKNPSKSKQEKAHVRARFVVYFLQM